MQIIAPTKHTSDIRQMFINTLLNIRCNTNIKHRVVIIRKNIDARLHLYLYISLDKLPKLSLATSIICSAVMPITFLYASSRVSISLYNR